MDTIRSVNINISRLIIQIIFVLSSSGTFRHGLMENMNIADLQNAEVPFQFAW